MNQIERIKQLLPIPIAPVDAGSRADWSRMESMLKTKLPIDYKDFINTYGSGYIGDLFHLWNPFSKQRNWNLILQFDEFHMLATDDFEAELPKPLYPKPGGLLPFASANTGDQIFWITEGEPDEWQLLKFSMRGLDYDVYSGTITEFLLSFLENRENDFYHPDLFNHKRLFSQP